MKSGADLSVGNLRIETERKAKTSIDRGEIPIFESVLLRNSLPDQAITDTAHGKDMLGLAGIVL